MNPGTMEILTKCELLRLAINSLHTEAKNGDKEEALHLLFAAKLLYERFCITKNRLTSKETEEYISSPAYEWVKPPSIYNQSC